MPKPWKRRDRSKEYQENKELIAARNKAWNKANRAKCNEHSVRHREKVKQRKWDEVVFKVTEKLEDFRQSRLRRMENEFEDNYGYYAKLATVKCQMWREYKRRGQI